MNIKDFNIQLDEWTHLDSYCKKETYLMQVRDNYYLDSNKLYWSIEKLKQVKNDVLDIVDKTIISDIDLLMEKLEKDHQAIENDETYTKTRNELAELAQLTNKKIEELKKFIIITLDYSICKELNFPTKLYFKGGKKKQQEFYNELINAFDSYCYSKLGKTSKRCGYSYIYSNRQLDEYRIAEDAIQALIWLNNELNKEKENGQ